MRGWSGRKEERKGGSEKCQFLRRDGGETRGRRTYTSAGRVVVLDADHTSISSCDHDEEADDADDEVEDEDAVELCATASLTGLVVVVEPLQVRRRVSGCATEALGGEKNRRREKKEERRRDCGREGREGRETHHEADSLETKGGAEQRAYKTDKPS